MARLKEELAKHAVTGTMQAGFHDVGARNLASIMACIGAAQLLAATHRPLYGIFRMLCLSMATTSSVEAAMAKIAEMGDEMFGPPLQKG